MREIARGAQFKTFEDGDRVRKIPLSPAESEEVVRSWHYPYETPAEELATDYIGRARISCRGIERILTENPTLAPHLCNPIFEPNGGYNQDRVTTLQDKLVDATDAEAGRLVEDYIGQILFFWGYGFSEMTFNPLSNNGIDANGKVVLIDLGELYFDKEDVRRIVLGRSWRKSWTYRSGLRQPLKERYSSGMQRLTEATLDEVWKSEVAKKP
jgi:hypothetical protein